MKTEILSEIEQLEKDYEIIKNFLKGTQYDVSQIRITLQSFKDHISRVRSLVTTYFKMQGKVFNIRIRPILHNIDVALLFMELYPQMSWQEVRGILQMAFTFADTKIEDVMSSILALKKTTFA